MVFLNPLWLFALPLIALPILIHLLNQRRHRTVNWGAMQFLLTAKRMSRGMARLKQWLIMAARMAIIAGLIFAVARPLSSGWVGSITGGQPETVIVVLDRSASMNAQQIQTGETKLAAGVKKIVAALQTVGRQKPIVLIDSCSTTPLIVHQPADLIDLPQRFPTDTTADFPALLQTTLDYITDNQTGRTDIWICSDTATNDWNVDSTRWQSLNSGFAKLEGVRFQLLNYPAPPTDNLSIEVNRFERIPAADDPTLAELVLDVTIHRSAENQSSATVPVTFTINGLRSVLNVEMTSEFTTLTGHRIPLDAETRIGWGVLELPADSNLADNVFYFSFADPPVRQTVIVSENETSTRAIELAAATTIQPGVEFQSKSIGPEMVAEIDWSATALLIWQAPLPTGNEAKQVERFLASGRSVIFLPPAEADENSFAGWQWNGWSEVEELKEKTNSVDAKIITDRAIEFWNNEEDLLARTRSGDALPVNDLLIYRVCKLVAASETSEPLATLAKIHSNTPLLSRLKGSLGTIYFLTTWPTATHSSLDREGIVLFVMIQRAIAQGVDSLGAAKQFTAGTSAASVVAELNVLASLSQSEQTGAGVLNMAADRPFRAGVYGTPEHQVALNRPLVEDRSVPLSRAEIDQLFSGLDYAVIEDEVGNGKSLASEIWRMFVMLMGIALLLEAWLCLPVDHRRSRDHHRSEVSRHSLRERSGLFAERPATIEEAIR